MATANNSCSQFDAKLETVEEFLERFTLQCSEQLAKAGDNQLKKTAVLVKALPITIIIDLQQRITPVKLSEASYDDLVAKLTNQ